MTTPLGSSNGTRRRKMRRRSFVRAGAVAGLTVVGPRLVRGTQVADTIRLGMIGCGSRGQWIAKLFASHGGYKIVAAADYFRDRVDALGEKMQVQPNRRFTGLAGFKRLLDSRIDAVVIESPPYFHPQHAAAAVDAGCHVFLAKPIAVDVPGCLSVAASGKRAAEKRQCFLVDFQTRANPLYREAIRRVHAGHIGPIVNGEAVYFCGPTWNVEKVLARDPENKELQLRCWGVNRTLSGDVITEQNIHALDVATWILDQHPLKAYGTGGRKARRGPGDCYDHFSVIFYFADDVVVSFTSKQFGKGYDDIGCRMYGPEGTIDTHYFGTVSIAGSRPFPGGPVRNLYSTGAEANIATFYESITAGRFANSTVAPSVRSNLTTILGRMAAYRSGEVTWREMLQKGEKWEFDLAGLRS